MSETILRTNYALLLFYVREKYWQHVEQVCLTTLQSTDDSMFRVWRAMALDRQGQSNEALREYKAVEGKRQTAIPALMGSLLIHKHHRDQESTAATEAKLEGFDVDVDHLTGWLQAAALCWAVGDLNAARDLLLKLPASEEVLTYRDEYTNYGTIRGWVDLLSGRGALLEKAGTFFSKVLDAEQEQYQYYGAADGEGGSGSGKWLDLNAALGRVAYLERKGELPAAQDLLNRLIVLYPNCSTPPLVVKAHLLMHAEDWEQAVETTRRILTKEKDNVEALALEALYAMVKDTRQDAAALRLRRLLEAVNLKESRNAPLMHLFAQLFGRLAGDRLDALNVTTSFAEAACALNSRNGDYLCELGYQQIFKKEIKLAFEQFKKASTLTDSTAPLLGTIHCHIAMNHLEEASKQLAFCNKLQTANERNAELSWLNARVIWKMEKDERKALLALDQASDAIRHDVLAQTGSGMELYIRLNCPVAIGIAHEYVQHSRSEPPDPTFKQPDVVAERCARHLALVVRHLPACMEAQLLLAKVNFVSGDVRKAQTLLKTVLLVQEQPLPDAFLLSSQICQYMGDVKLALRALEQALTLDFSLKEQPLYCLLLGTAQGTTGKAAESLETLQRAMEIVGALNKAMVAATAGSSAASVLTSSTGRPIQPLTVPEQVTLFLQLAQAHLRVHDVEAARATLTEAALFARPTSQAGRVAIAQAMLAARTDVDKSIELLRQVPSSSAFYVPARSQLAKLYLTQKHNTTMYIQCFEEMAKEVPSTQSYVELGEAYTTIQDPEQAIRAYEKAQAMSPSSSDLSVRVGRALVSAHDYTKAVTYYQDALAADPHLATVRADLATLLWRLGQSQLAQDTLVSSPVYATPQSTPDEGLATAIERVNLYLLLYKIRRDDTATLATPAEEPAPQAKGGDGKERSGTPVPAEVEDAALTALLGARQHQQYLLDHQLRGEGRDLVVEQQAIMANMCTELGRRYVVLASQPSKTAASRAALFQQAKEALGDAIKYDESCEAAQVELASLCAQLQDVDGCQERCAAVLRMNPNSEEAVSVLASVMLQQGRVDVAISTLEELLSTTATNYEALVKYIVLLYKAGELDKAEAALEKAAAAIPQGQRVDPGLSYARGLYAHFGCNNSDALREFNVARLPADNPWCERAITAMIRIYLVPHTQDLWVTPNVDPEKNTSRRASTTGAGAAPARGDLKENVRFAEQLLLLLPVASEARRVLRGYCTLAAGRPGEVETSMHLFLECIQMAEEGRLHDAHHGTEANVHKLGVEAAAAAANGSAKKSTNSSTKRRKQVQFEASDDDDEKDAPEDDEEDEDDLLLANIHEAAAAMAASGTGGSSTTTTATLAFALQCKKVFQPAFLGLAMSLYRSKQETAARNVLARVLTPTDAKTEASKGASPSSSPATSSAAADPLDNTLERARLFLAYMDTEAGQLDAAKATLEKVIELNKGCGAGWDALGGIYERQQKHREASECYQKAWKMLRENDPAVGYKLAFNHLRGNAPVKAIDVCRRVLAHHAAYPCIEEDVMDVAYGMLRP